jgi:hypothetical protein
MPTIAQTIEKVDSFAKLQIGWHFGEGAPPTGRLRKKAIEFLRYAEISGIARANAFPGVAGQIQVTFYHEDSMLELNIEGDGTVTIAEDEKQEQVYFKENASETDARTKLMEFSEKVMTTRNGDHRSFQAKYTTDGKETEQEVMGRTAMTSAKWEGDALVIEFKSEGGSFKRKITLSADGKTITKAATETRGDGQQSEDTVVFDKQ